MPSDGDAQAVLSYYAPATGLVRRVEAIGTGGGWSGSRLWRAETAGGPLCLRRWPAEHPSAARLAFIHRVLCGVDAAGVDFVPVPMAATSGETFVSHGGHLWELTPWLPGRADFRQQPTAGRLANAFAALARFHLAAARAAGSAHGIAPAVTDRQFRLRELARGEFNYLVAALRGGSDLEIDRRARAILCATHGRLERLAEEVAAIARKPQLLQPAIRDIHHDHVLFTAEEVTGIVDFGALRVDTPLADIARLLGSLVEDDVAMRRVALAAYCSVRPLAGDNVPLIDLLDRSGVVLGGLNWLKWLYLEERDMGAREPILFRLDQIVRRLAAFYPGQPACFSPETAP